MCVETGKVGEVGMNLIDKDKLTKDFEEECVGECSCCRHSIRGTGECGFIAEFPIEIEIVRCKDCSFAFFKEGLVLDGHIFCTKPGTERGNAVKPNDWYCGDGKRSETDGH